MLKTVYRSSCRDKHNCQRRDSNLDPLALQTDVLTTRLLRPALLIDEHVLCISFTSLLLFAFSALTLLVGWQELKSKTELWGSGLCLDLKLGHCWLGIRKSTQPVKIE